jgi:hypothetical protein
MALSVLKEMNSMLREPLEVEVVTYILGSLNHCTHCQVFIDGAGVGEKIHAADMESYPPEFMEEWQKLSDLVFSLTERFAGRLVVKITDAQSPQALWKALRQGIRKYPTFIVGKEKYHGLDEQQVSNLIQKYLNQPA